MSVDYIYIGTYVCGRVPLYDRAAAGVLACIPCYSIRGVLSDLNVLGYINTHTG